MPKVTSKGIVNPFHYTLMSVSDMDKHRMSIGFLMAPDPFITDDRNGSFAVKESREVYRLQFGKLLVSCLSCFASHCCSCFLTTTMLIGAYLAGNATFPLIMFTAFDAQSEGLPVFSPRNVTFVELEATCLTMLLLGQRFIAATAFDFHS
jgi:hypothetical protein